jgi:hypothetical protein
MLFASKSLKFRIFFSLFLVSVLSGSAMGEVFYLDYDDQERADLNLFDEESKAENEKSEENNQRKQNENTFEFSGADGEFEHDISDLNCFDQYRLPVCGYSYLYYPHINPFGLVSLRLSDYEETSRLVLYHKFVFYDLILNLN